ncbi:hypothetical protein XI92_33950 (plasmid) [Bacillus thuringiensis]|nr:hypothetical protein XI92_33950 [Bacillus thuringiensis]
MVSQKYYPFFTRFLALYVKRDFLSRIYIKGFLQWRVKGIAQMFLELMLSWDFTSSTICYNANANCGTP